MSQPNVTALLGLPFFGIAQTATASAASPSDLVQATATYELFEVGEVKNSPRRVTGSPSTSRLAARLISVADQSDRELEARVDG